MPLAAARRYPAGCVPVATGGTSAVQYAHRRASSGISLRHCGHPRVGCGGGSEDFIRAIALFIGKTTTK